MPVVRLFRGIFGKHTITFYYIDMAGYIIILRKDAIDWGARRFSENALMLRIHCRSSVLRC
jgi:hypothetical protein